MSKPPSSHTARCAAAVLLCAVALALTAAPAGAWPPMGAGTIVGPFAAMGVDGDSPPDGLFDLVLINASIDVSVRGDFSLSVQRDRYEWIGGRSFSLEVGLNPVQVPIDGVYLQQLGVNGPMDLTLILETGCAQGCQIIDQASFRTPSFRLTDLATPPKMTFPRPASDFAVDDDQPPDGRFDFVAVDVPVWVEKPGPYTLVGVYLSQARQVFNATNLEAGNSTIRLMIPGRDLRAVHVSGQFHLSLSMGSATGEHWTRPYLWSDFADEGATFGSGFRDAGLDTDVPPNGLYDVVTLQMPIHVTRSGDYRIGGTLASTSAPWIVTWASRPAYLSAGERQVDLQFPANQIVESAFNGSFRASVILADDFGVVDSANATTGNYSWTDFDPPSLVLAGPITDSYVDIDSPTDGVFDRYVVQVPIEVREAGRYAFTGLLYAAGRQMYASNLSDLAPGSTSVRLTWPLGSFTSVGAVPSGEAYVFAYRSQYDSAFSSSFTPSPPPAGGNGTTNLAGPELRVEGTPTTTLPDTNGNGLFDSLVYKLPVNVTRAGPYSFTAALMAFTNNYRVAHTTTHVVLPLGRSTVSLIFPAFSIRASHLGGPYTVYVRYWAGPTDPWPHEYDQQGESFTGSTPVLFSHQFEADRPVLPSASSTTAIVPDGVLEPAEWAGVSSFDLSGVDPGALPSRVLVANDAQNLYIALDVVGDRTADSLDSAGIAFDVKTLGSFDFGSDDEIGVGSTFALSETTFRLAALPSWCCGGYWILREAPFDHAAPERANLDAAIGFAASPADSVPHRTYEFRVPLALLNAHPGDTIGFAVYSVFTMGIRDASGRRLAWPASPPAFESLLPNEFGRVRLSGGPNRAPTVAWNAPLGGAYLSGVLHASGEAGDPDGTVRAVEVRLDQGSWVRASGTTSWSFDLDTKTITDGPHTFAVRSSDGLTYSEEVSVAFTVDNTPPSVAILSPTDGAALPQAPTTVSWSSQDATSGVDRVILRIDGGEPLTFQGPTSHRIPSLPDGIHEIRLTAVDRAGNERSSSVSITVAGPSAIAPSVLVIGVGLVAGVIAVVGVAAFLVTRRHRGKRT